mgnify:CR=1 FL=1
MTSEMDVLFPIPTGGRNADDMGLPSPIKPSLPDLTDADRAYLCSRIDESLRSENEYRSLIEDVFRAGLAAGRERAIEEAAANLTASSPRPR